MSGAAADGVAAAAGRVTALDLIRGLAVLGILAVNIAGFAGPQATTWAPGLLAPASPADETTFAAVFLLFEGKMRGLFTLAFGASMVLFIERTEDDGRDGERLQMRRLLWLMAIGFAHYVLLWWGDILFLYGLVGLTALALRQIEPKPMALAALAGYALWHLAACLTTLDPVLAETAVQNGTATGAQASAHVQALGDLTHGAQADLARLGGGFWQQAAYKLTEKPFWLVQMSFVNFGEALPLMLLGMALMRSGFLTGAWPKRWLIALATGGLIVGAAGTAAILAWVWPRHFPPMAMIAAITAWSALPRLLMSLGLAALLVLIAPRVLNTAPGGWLRATGRMALSNYLATSLAMTFVFGGWGLDLAGQVGPAGQFAMVGAAWIVMLAWSPLWLRRFRLGPAEWLWRSLVDGQNLPLRLVLRPGDGFPPSKE